MPIKVTNKSGKTTVLKTKLPPSKIKVGDVIIVHMCKNKTNTMPYNKIIKKKPYKNIKKNLQYLLDKRKNCVEQILKSITIVDIQVSENPQVPSLIVGRHRGKITGDFHMFISDRDDFYEIPTTQKGNILLGLFDVYSIA